MSGWGVVVVVVSVDDAGPSTKRRFLCDEGNAGWSNTVSDKATFLKASMFEGY
jgi:hypothetical protein